MTTKVNDRFLCVVCGDESDGEFLFLFTPLYRNCFDFGFLPFIRFTLRPIHLSSLRSIFQASIESDIRTLKT